MLKQSRRFYCDKKEINPFGHHATVFVVIKTLHNDQKLNAWYWQDFFVEILQQAPEGPGSAETKIRTEKPPAAVCKRTATWEMIYFPVRQ